MSSLSVSFTHYHTLSYIQAHSTELLDNVKREAAQTVLLSFDQAPDCILRCKAILDISSSPYARLLATSTLTKAISKISCTLTLAERIHIRNYALDFLFSRSPMESFVAAELYKLVARITKLGWYYVDRLGF